MDDQPMRQIISDPDLTSYRGSMPSVFELPHGSFALFRAAKFRACISISNRHTDRMNTMSFLQKCLFVTPADQLARAQNIAGAVCFSELAPQQVRWLWPDPIPPGGITDHRCMVPILEWHWSLPGATVQNPGGSFGRYGTSRRNSKFP